MFTSYIAGVGHYVPENVVTNQDLSQLMDTNDEWITERTGIKERRWVTDGDGNTTSAMGVKAAKMAIENAGITKDDIDFIVFATLSPDYYFPGPGVLVQRDLGRTPLIQGSGSPTQLSVTATNCIGTSSASSIIIVDEDPAWCPGSPYWQPYPIGCECCEPGEDPNPKKTDKEQAQFKLTPNPTHGFLTFNLPTIAPAQISIYTTEGKLIEQFTLIGGDTEYQLDSKINAGIYMVHIIQADASAIEKLIVLK